jgi:putative FmdB family regulatory protein
MPTYVYLCQSCHQQQEFWQKMSDPLLTECPLCHQPSLEKQLSAPAFQLKGGGWYATDFKANSTPNQPSSQPETPTAKQETESAPANTTAPSS